MNSFGCVCLSFLLVLLLPFDPFPLPPLLSLQSYGSSRFYVTHALDPVSPKNPYYQHLPDCSKGNYPIIQKKTDWKGIVCPMIKDEVGFLAEWAAFYEMMGFNHIIFFDNNSTSPLTELEPWIKTGFAEVISNWWAEDAKRGNLFRNPKQRFNDMMRIKYLSEVICKKKAIELGYDVFISVDMDEFLFPTYNSMTVMDELAEWFQDTQRRVILFNKDNFNPVPHFLEPINLLVIEAFQVRMKGANKMNYYKSIAQKVGLWLSKRNDSRVSDKTTEYIINCCDFHGCGNYKIHRACWGPLKDERWNLEGKHLKYKDGPHIHHYARSLEKFMLKQKTWETSGGDNRGYDFYHFIDRVSGYTFDDSAISWGCQLRDVLKNRTREDHFLRAGDFWYRNPEFGRLVTDPMKRGRFGSGLGKILGFGEMNPYPPGDTYQLSHKQYSPEKDKKSEKRSLRH